MKPEAVKRASNPAGFSWRGWFGRLPRHHGPAGQDLGVTPDLAWGLGFRGVWVGALLWVTGFLLFAVIVPIPGWLLSMVAIHR